MAVYVDDAMIPATVPNGRVTHTSQWSHLIADTEDELHAFAARLGLKREWYQGPDQHGDLWHYDVTAGKRQQALRLGARPVTWREAAEKVHARRQQEPAPDAQAVRCADIGCTDHPGDDPSSAAERELTGEQQADEWAAIAREHWQAGRLALAAAYNHACRETDNARCRLWAARAERLLDKAARSGSLAELTAVRLAVAGIGPDDPGIRQLREHNGAVSREAGS